MNEELTKWVAKGGAFIEQEAPELAREIVTWAIVSNSVFLVLLVIAGICLMFCAVVSINKAIKDDDPFFAVCGVTSILAVVFCIIGSVASASDLVKAVYCPRLVIVEGVKGLVN